MIVFQDEEDRYLESKASYNAWLEKTKDFKKDKIIAKRKEAKKKREAEQEKIEKEKDAKIVSSSYIY